MGIARLFPAPFFPHTMVHGEVCTPKTEQDSRYQSVVGLQDSCPRTRQDKSALTDGVVAFLINRIDLVVFGKTFLKNTGNFVEGVIVFNRDEQILSVLIHHF